MGAHDEHRQTGPGLNQVIVAGQPGVEMEALHRDEGIPLHPEVSQSIGDI